MSFKIDLHTHSHGSPDGSLKATNYRYFLENNLLDYIAITDHNSIEAAFAIQRELGELGNRIIVGEEVMTTEGEIIGLYLTQQVPAGLTAAETVKHIKAQKGLVYIPHPFETIRSGISKKVLQTIIDDVDIIEAYNGRAIFQSKSKKAYAVSTQTCIPHAASSDTHGRFGWGYTYSVINRKPTRGNLVRLLDTAEHSPRTVGLGILYPKINRIRNKLHRGKRV